MEVVADGVGVKEGGELGRGGIGVRVGGNGVRMEGDVEGGGERVVGDGFDIGGGDDVGHNRRAMRLIRMSEIVGTIKGVYDKWGKWGGWLDMWLNVEEGSGEVTGMGLIGRWFE